MILHPVSLHQVTGCFHNNTITLLETTHEFRSWKINAGKFLTLVASGVGFATRTAAGGTGTEFNIGGAEFGAILGAWFSRFWLDDFFR